jgi:aspartyl-tRNA(Asn)/glutamyl-tRNA(Gln) amidotransferase subunit A
VGCFGQTAEDVIEVFIVMAGHDPRDATSISLPLEMRSFDNGKKPLTGLKVGIPKEYFIKGIQPDVEAGVRAGIRQLQDRWNHRGQPAPYRICAAGVLHYRSGGGFRQPCPL